MKKLIKKPRNIFSKTKKSGRFNVLASVAAAFVVLIGGYAVISSQAAVGNATLSLDPSSRIVANQETFTVAVRENSGTSTVNAVQAKLSYPATSLELVGISGTGSAFPIEAESQGSNGSITIARGTNGGQSVTGSQLVATLTFKSLMTTGSATVSFTAGSAVISSVDNTALTLTTQNGTYQPDTVAPSAVQNLSSTNVTGTSLTLNWSAATDNVGVTGYDVQRNGVKIATVSGATTTFNDTGLSQGTTYQYRVFAFDAAGNRPTTGNTHSVTTLDTTAPSVPTNVSAQATAYDKVTVSWNASTDTGGSGLAGYRVYRGTSTTPITSTTQTTFNDTGLSGSTSYTYRIAAYDVAGNESAKTTGTSVTTPAAPDTTAPTAPGSLRVTSSGLSEINLAWNASSDNVGVTGYRVYRDGSLVGSPTSLAFKDTSLNYGTTYQYTVRAIDAAGNLSSAALLSAATLQLKVGDVNRDNEINIYDLSLLLGKWLTADSASDLNGDGIVDIFDLSRLLSNWGK